MNNTTYTSNENCFLIDGEVYFTKLPEYCNRNIDGLNTVGGINFLTVKGVCYIITHSTNKDLDNIVSLPRDKFVKPVDYIELAIEEFGEDKVNRLVVDIFTKGHNANPNDFTRDEMIKAMNAVHNNPLIILDIPAYINHLRPLSLPESIQINEQGEIVNVIWI